MEANEFIKDNETILALIGLGNMFDEYYRLFKDFCKERGISKEDAHAMLNMFLEKNLKKFA